MGTSSLNSLPLCGQYVERMYRPAPCMHTTDQCVSRAAQPLPQRTVTTLQPIVVVVIVLVLVLVVIVVGVVVGVVIRVVVVVVYRYTYVCMRYIVRTSWFSFWMAMNKAVAPSAVFAFKSACAFM